MLDGFVLKRVKEGQYLLVWAEGYIYVSCDKELKLNTSVRFRKLNPGT